MLLRARPIVLTAIVIMLSTGLLIESQLAPAYGSASTGGGSGFSFNRSEACLMQKINKVRRNHGKRSLRWDHQLGQVARRHASEMASRWSVYHDYDMGQKVTNWRRLAQNTGAGGRCRRVFRSFMRSSTHRGNVLGRWRFMGVGTTWRNGRMFVQQIFESRLDPGNTY